MIEIIRRYIDKDGDELYEHRDLETGWHGYGVTQGKTDEELIAHLQELDAFCEEMRRGPVMEGPPPVGSLQHRMQSEAEAGHPEIAPLSEIWAEQQGYPPIPD